MYSDILASPGTGELITIDPTTGIGTAVGPAGAGDFEGLVAYPPIQFIKPVGGTVVPVNKFELLIPYIGVISIILVTITIIVKKRRLNYTEG